MSWCPLRIPWGLRMYQCLRRPFDIVRAQVWSPWSPWDNDKSPVHPVECSSTPKSSYGSPVVSLGFPNTTTMPYCRWLCPWWVEKIARVQMTLSVVICVLLRYWYPRRSLGTPTPWWSCSKSCDNLVDLTKVPKTLTFSYIYPMLYFFPLKTLMIP